LLGVTDVVDQIDTTANGAEYDGSGEAPQERLQLEDMPIEGQRREDETVLRPLQRSQGADDRWLMG
jgi:hypothetical protein